MRTSHVLWAFALLLVVSAPAAAQVPGDGCAYPVTYWVDHPDLWPVDQLELAQVVLSKDELLVLLDTNGSGADLDALMRETIAAKLNVANGAPPEIGPYITWGDLLLVTGKDNDQRLRDLRGSAVVNSTRQILSGYNDLGCNADASDVANLLPTSDTEGSFGTLKSRFR